MTSKEPVAIEWRCCRFDALSLVELQNIYRARQQVFSVEQDSVYLDADGLDEQAWHVAAWVAGEVLPRAYARLLGPGVKYAEPSMGRVLTTAAARGTGLGRELVKRMSALAEEVFPGLGNRISAQAHLQPFYGAAGYVAVGETYLEDGIPHIEMLRSAVSSPSSGKS